MAFDFSKTDPSRELANSDSFDAASQFLLKANQQSAVQQMQFQDYMSSTAHQREVGDLLLAGLNPILSANNGASTGQGAYANVDNSAISAKFAEKQLQKQLDNQTKLEKLKVASDYKIAQDKVQAEKEISKYNADLNYTLGMNQSENSLRGTMYSADTAREASKYSTDINASNAERQRVWQADQYSKERDWSTSEREASQSWQTSEYDKQKKFESEEAFEAREWQGKQNKYNRKVQKYGIEKGYDASVYGANSAYAASVYGANASAAAQKYGSYMNYLGTKYTSDNNLTNANLQREWDAAHPSTKYQMYGSIYDGIKDWFNTKKNNNNYNFNDIYYGNK